MDKLGLKQLFERFTEYMVIFEQLKGKHSLKTYRDLANISKDLDAAIVKDFQSTTELADQLTKRLENHKTESIIGITKSIDDLLDRISERATAGKRTDRLEEYFNLLIMYCIPKDYSEQREAYLNCLYSQLADVKFCGDEVREAYAEAAA